MVSWRRFPAILIGLVFTFSSALKLMDPVGTGLIIEAYLEFFHIQFLGPASVALGEFLSLVEAVVGAGLLTGIARRFFAVAASSLTAFFTLISILLVVFNPQMSCGCFGQAIPLSHTQTLFKNIILVILCVFAFTPINSLGFPRRSKKVAFTALMAITAVFAGISILQTPLKEYTAFRSSNTIVPEDEIYGDSSDHPSLYVWSESGEDMSYQVYSGRKALISVYNPSGLSQASILKIASFAQDAQNAGFEPLLISSGPVSIPGLTANFADRKEILALNRSNGGVSFLSDGLIVDKRSNILPLSFDKMEKMAAEDPAVTCIKTSTRRSLILQGFVAAFIAAVVFL